MSTGYTAGILDGTTKDFNDFAKLCSRAFMVHLRDEPMNSEYKKREVSNYRLKKIENAKNQLKEVDNLTDEELIVKEKNRLIESKKYHLYRNKEKVLDKIKINSFLEKAKSYVPPTENHQGIANFMIEQLEKTIEFDCDSAYHIAKLKTIDSEIANVKASIIRDEMKAKAIKDIACYIKEYEDDVKRCEDHNQWYEDFIKNL